jgi:hypothetical protein
MDGPFLGSRAVADGLLTPAELRGPRFVPLFRDVFVEAGAEIDLVVLSKAPSAGSPPRSCSARTAARPTPPPSSSPRTATWATAAG